MQTLGKEMIEIVEKLLGRLHDAESSRHERQKEAIQSIYIAAIETKKTIKGEPDALSDYELANLWFQAGVNIKEFDREFSGTLVDKADFRLAIAGENQKDREELNLARFNMDELRIDDLISRARNILIRKYS